MLYAIHSLDYSDAYERRMANYEAHLAYLKESPLKLVLAGPLLAEDGEKRIGSFQVVEASNRAELQKFHEGDPFKKNRVWEVVSIHPYIMSTVNL